MDDSNSHWWLVRVLKIHEIGYIPAENIKMSFGRLARLNKHRNVDVCTLSQPSIYIRNNLCHSQLRLTQAEMQDELQESRDQFRNNKSIHASSNSPTPGSDARMSHDCVVTTTCTAIRYFHPCSAGSPLSSHSMGG